MTLPPKWYLFVMLLWFVTVFLLSITVGQSAMDTGTTTTINGMVVQGNAEVSTITSFWHTLTSIIQFGDSKMAFFNVGIGSYIRAILVIIGGIIGLFTAYDIVRILKPFSS
jgi:uncharacterized membrane protein YciS (DUF1049 family)